MRKTEVSTMDGIGRPKQHVPIFVGSTWEDVKDHRKAVRDTLHRLETIVRGMEYFGSKPGSPREECLKAVRSCRVYIGVFAMRYGSIDEETGKSMTHIEYDEAQLLRLPTLIYLIDENKQPVIPKFVDIGESGTKLADLKAELKRRFTVSFFTTPEDLAKRLSQDLPPILENIGIEIEKKEEEAVPADDKELIRRFKVRPKKYAGQDITLNGVVQGGAGNVLSDTASAFDLTLGDAIQRKIDFPLLDDFKQVVGEGKMADWLEDVKQGTSQKMRIRLLFGENVEVDWTDDGPITHTEVLLGYKLMELLGR